MSISTKLYGYSFGIPFTLLTASTALIAQEINPNAEQEILVMSRPGIINLTDGRTEAALDEITFQVAEIRNVLTRNTVERVFQAFPNFKLTVEIMTPISMRRKSGMPPPAAAVCRWPFPTAASTTTTPEPGSDFGAYPKKRNIFR